MGEVPIKTRKSQKRVVQWCKLSGDDIHDTKEFPCKYIPVARVIGNEWVVEGKTYLSGLVRNAKDSQRMYNVAQTAIVERVMQAPKSPWLAPVEAIEGYEKQWQTANTANHAFLPYNHLDDQGNAIPSPTRTQPATVETGLNQIAQGASDDIKSETGQYDASLGQKSNETSGKAIMARQREGDNATYHYVDNLGRAVRHIGRIVLDMIPKIYDTQRVARILGEDGSTAQATLDPAAPQAYAEVKTDTGELQKIFNPNIGTYDVYTTSGPSFTTRRIEAVEAMTAMTQANPELWQVIGDKLVAAMDWPGAEEMAERLKLTLLPQVQQTLDKDKGEPQIPPQVQQAMEQLQGQTQQMEQALVTASEQVDQLESQLQGKDAQIMAAQAKAMKLEIELREVESMRAIEEAEQQAVANVQAMQEQLEQRLQPQERAMSQDGAKDEIERYRIDRDHDAKVKVAQIQHLGKVQAEEPQEPQEEKPDQVAMAIAMLAEHISRPKRIVFNEAGRPVGVE
jgi:hypothetical protein